MLEYSWKQEFVSHKVRLAKIPVAHLIDIVACLLVNTLRKVIGILIDAFIHVCHSGWRKKKVYYHVVIITSIQFFILNRCKVLNVTRNVIKDMDLLNSMLLPMFKRL